MAEPSVEDFDSFNKYGYMVVKNAFSKETAALCRDKMWTHIKGTHGVDRLDQSTWIPKVLSDKMWTEQDGIPWSEVFTTRLQNGIDSLVGSNKTESFGAGWWTVTFPGFSEPPWGAEGSWHIDGNGYQHYPFSKEVGVVPMMLFSDILPGGGGTAVAEASHLVACQVLAEAGLRGCSAKELAKTVMQSGIDFDIIEITGEAGDVILLHPFLLHARSANLMPKNEDYVRFLCHPNAPLKENMDFTKNIDEMSVLEASIVRAIVGEEENDISSLEADKDNLIIENKNDDQLEEKGENTKKRKKIKICDKNCEECFTCRKLRYFERKKLFDYITPEACFEFAERKKRKKIINQDINFTENENDNRSRNENESRNINGIFHEQNNENDNKNIYVTKNKEDCRECNSHEITVERSEKIHIKNSENNQSSNNVTLSSEDGINSALNYTEKIVEKIDEKDLNENKINDVFKNVFKNHTIIDSSDQFMNNVMGFNSFKYSNKY